MSWKENMYIEIFKWEFTKWFLCVDIELNSLDSLTWYFDNIENI